MSDAILGISASPRKNSNSRTMLRAILKGAASLGANCKDIDVARLTIRACLGCEKCRGQGLCKGLRDDMSDLYGEILQAHGLVLVTPTHNYNVSVSMKAFIDRLYAFYDFADSRPRTWSSRLGGMGKKAVIAAVCEQMSPYDMGFALEAMERPLQALGYEIVGKLPVLGIFDAGLVAADEEVMARAHKAGEDLVKALED